MQKSLTSEKEVIKSHKYRIYPNAEQRSYLDKTFGQCRFVWNKLLGDYQESYDAFKILKEKDPSLKFKDGCSSFDFVRKLSVLRNNPEFQWLRETSAHIQQQRALSLGKAFANFFNKKGYPNFKKKGHNDFFKVSYQKDYIVGNGLILPKLEVPIKINKYKNIQGKIKELQVSKSSSGKYFLTVVMEFLPAPQNGTDIVGVDLGITTLASLSSGEKIENPRHFAKNQKRLRILQRRLSKKQKGSQNRDKARIRVAKLHEKIANCRSDFMHKLTTRLVRENQAVGIECLHVKGMVRNRRLAKHITDAAFGMFRRQLTYKAKWSQHCVIVAASQYYASTQICSNCKAAPEVKLKLSTRNWTCKCCGCYHDRDTNAAINLEDTARTWLPAAILAKSHVFIAPLKTNNDAYPLGVI